MVHIHLPWPAARQRTEEIRTRGTFGGSPETQPQSYWSRFRCLICHPPPSITFHHHYPSPIHHYPSHVSPSNTYHHPSPLSSLLSITYHHTSPSPSIDIIIHHCPSPITIHHHPPSITTPSPITIHHHPPSITIITIHQLSPSINIPHPSPSSLSITYHHPLPSSLSITFHHPSSCPIHRHHHYPSPITIHHHLTSTIHPSSIQIPPSTASLTFTFTMVSFSRPGWKHLPSKS